jgi:protein-S-isoprenylcysteine O-methyltransferase Ste14
MPAKIVAAVVFFGVIGTLCAVMFFANIGSDNTAGTGILRVIGAPTSFIGLAGAVAAYGLLVYVLISYRKNRSR